MYIHQTYIRFWLWFSFRKRCAVFLTYDYIYSESIGRCLTKNIADSVNVERENWVKVKMEHKRTPTSSSSGLNFSLKVNAPVHVYNLPVNWTQSIFTVDKNNAAIEVPYCMSQIIAEQSNEDGKMITHMVLETAQNKSFVTFGKVSAIKSNYLLIRQTSGSNIRWYFLIVKDRIS